MVVERERSLWWSDWRTFVILHQRLDVADGQPITTHLTVRPHYGPGGVIVGEIPVCRDSHAAFYHVREGTQQTERPFDPECDTINTISLMIGCDAQEERDAMSQKTVAEIEAELEEAKKREAEDAKTKKDEEDKTKKEEPTGSSNDDKDLGENGKKALQEERDARRAAVARATEAEKELKRIKDAQEEADRKAAEDQGNYKKLYEDLIAKHETLEADLKKKERDALRTKVAGNHNLPSDLVERLAGETEAELEADAEKLAKLVKATPPPNTETGTSTKPPPKETKRDPKSYVFVPTGAVTIPD